jgi:RNA polymerase sigma-70 factor, ECF subfamily
MASVATDVLVKESPSAETGITLLDEGLKQHHLDFESEAVPHMDALYNFALRMTSDPDDANDLLQETYLKAYRFFDKFERGTNCKAWLFRIMKNSFINIYRRVSKEPDKVDYDDVEEFYHSIRAASTDPNDLEERLFSNLLDDDVSKALEDLPEDFRTVVILCDIEAFTYEEIADFVECPIGTVRSRLHRGRKMLRAKLFDYAKNRGYADADDIFDD